MEKVADGEDSGSVSPHPAAAAATFERFAASRTELREPGSALEFAPRAHRAHMETAQPRTMLNVGDSGAGSLPTATG